MKAEDGLYRIFFCIDAPDSESHSYLRNEFILLPILLLVLTYRHEPQKH